MFYNHYVVNNIGKLTLFNEYTIFEIKTKELIDPKHKSPLFDDVNKTYFHKLEYEFYIEHQTPHKGSIETTDNKIILIIPHNISEGLCFFKCVYRIFSGSDMIYETSHHSFVSEKKQTRNIELNVFPMEELQREITIQMFGDNLERHNHRNMIENIFPVQDIQCKLRNNVFGDNLEDNVFSMQDLKWEFEQPEIEGFNMSENHGLEFTEISIPVEQIETIDMLVRPENRLVEKNEDVYQQFDLREELEKNNMMDMTSFIKQQRMK